MKDYFLNIDPVSKPRMVRSDKWKKRKVIDHYWAFKDELVLKSNLLGLKSLPGDIYSIYFFIKMPESWSEKKKLKIGGKPHMQRPDLDNLIKALQDCLCKEDSHIWHIGGITKQWAFEGGIHIIIEDKYIV